MFAAICNQKYEFVVGREKVSCDDEISSDAFRANEEFRRRTQASSFYVESLARQMSRNSVLDSEKELSRENEKPQMIAQFKVTRGHFHLVKTSRLCSHTRAV